MKIEIDKPIVPQFVADWIESFYNEGGSKYDAVGSIFVYSSKYDKNVHDWYVNNKDDFITAIMYGYDIQKEPRYYARIKGWELIVDERDITYWMIDKQKNGLFVGELPFFSIDLTGDYGYVTELTADQWNELGIYDDVNAVFISKEDMNDSNS